MKVKNLYFSEEYFKLTEIEFHTIRGKSWYDKHKINDIFDVAVKGKFRFKAKLVKKELMQISKIPFIVLYNDTKIIGQPPIKNYYEFLYFMNQFRKDFMPKLTLFSDVCLLHFKRCS